MTFSAYLKEYWEKNPEVKSDQELIHLLQKEYGKKYEPNHANGQLIRENLIGQINSYLTYLAKLPKDSSLSLNQGTIRSTQLKEMIFVELWDVFNGAKGIRIIQTLLLCENKKDVILTEKLIQFLKELQNDLIEIENPNIRMLSILHKKYSEFDAYLIKK